MSSARMRGRIDACADVRETRESYPLGAGYYTEGVREDAAQLADDWLAAAKAHGVTLDDLDGCTDLANGALDAVQSSGRRRLRERRVIALDEADQAPSR